MPKLGIQEIAGVTRGSLENVPQDQESLVFSDFHFDTRLIGSEETLFFALKTRDNDGHRFVRDLDHRQGVGAVVAKDFDAAGLTLPLIRVDDPLAAAQQLAVHVRNKFRKTKYIGVTGSAGKTTTKELIYQLLSHKYKTHRSHENWNNWIGLPFSLLKMTGEEEAAVFELAMSDPGIGEIDLLADIVRPDVAVILNVYPVHLEFLKSLDNIAAAKSEILNHLAAGDVGFINGDSQPLRQAVAPKRGRKVFFGKSTAHNDIILKEVIREKDGTRLVAEFYGIKTEFSTHIINRVLSENLFVAVVVCQHLGMKHFEIQQALSDVQSLARRGEIYRKNGFTIIDETYNSNPEALKKALDWVDQEFLEWQGQKIAVLGDMLELGEGEEDFHFDVGTFFSGLHFDFLVTVGRRAEKIAEGAQHTGYAGEKVKMCGDATEAGRFLRGIAGAESVILLKASRGIALERTLQELFND